MWPGPHPQWRGPASSYNGELRQNASRAVAPAPLTAPSRKGLFLRVLTIIPTYNELESLPKTLGRLRAAVPHSDVLVVDDNSPDGTGSWPTSIAAEDGQVHVLHRKGKEGLGAAYIAGFKWGLAAGYDVLVEMDADGSHQPEQLPLLLDAIKDGADLAMGSRWVPGGGTVNWPLYRQAISRTGSTYARHHARLENQRRHRRLPRFPSQHPRGAQAGPGGIGWLRLPSGPGLARGQAWPEDRRTPHHVRGARAWGLQNERQHCC